MTAAGTSGRLLRAAALIAAITVIARVAGFGRTAVFARSVGAGCVGAVYQTANTIPNIVFDIVAGGTLSALVVPILAPAMSAEQRQAASRIVSALLTWTLAVMTVVAIGIVAVSGPLTRLLLGDDQCAGAHALGARMLVAFAPQVLFYGLGIVLGGALQSAERFAWPALAPLLSSLTVIGVYLAYGALAGPGRDAADLSRPDELVLSLGTTLGVVVLACCQLPAVWRLGIRYRPTFRFPQALGAPARRAALAGGATLGAQQLATAVMVFLANNGTTTGTVVVVALAQTVFLLPWAVLSVPVATSAFPRLSASWDRGDRDGFAHLAGRSTRAVIALAALGTAALVAAAEPAAGLLLDRHSSPAHPAFAPAIAGFAAGLLGWSLVALLSRMLFAARLVAVAARGQVIGWGAAIAADIVLAAIAPSRDRALVLALGNGVGVSVAATLLIAAAWRHGMIPDVLRLVRDIAQACGAGAAGAFGGWLVGRLARGQGVLAALSYGAAAAVLAVVIALAVLAAVDRDLVRAARDTVRRQSVQ